MCLWRVARGSVGARAFQCWFCRNGSQDVNALDTFTGLLLSHDGCRLSLGLDELFSFLTCFTIHNFPGLNFHTCERVERTLSSVAIFFFAVFRCIHIPSPHWFFLGSLLGRLTHQRASLSSACNQSTAWSLLSLRLHGFFEGVRGETGLPAAKVQTRRSFFPLP